MNFLEQLAVEWYTYKRFFVASNLKYGPLDNGGYEGEIDVLAFDPNEKVLFHIETSSDAHSWERRKEIFRRKFDTSEQYYKELFPIRFKEVRKIAIVSWGTPKDRSILGKDIELKTISEFVQEIAHELSHIPPSKRAVSENLPLLRAIQFAAAVSSPQR